MTTTPHDQAVTAARMLGRVAFHVGRTRDQLPAFMAEHRNTAATVIAVLGEASATEYLRDGYDVAQLLSNMGCFAQAPDEREASPATPLPYWRINGEVRP